MVRFGVLLMAACAAGAEDWRPLLNGRDLTGWEVYGEGVWTVRADGSLVARANMPRKQPFGPWPADEKTYSAWHDQQSWLYTVEEFENYDLRLEYRLPPLGNSGISLRDSSRGRHSFGEGERKTPAHIGYEIQLYHSDQTKYPSGSVYLFSPAKAGLQRANDWNVLEIESRADLIRVRLNGQLAAESPGDPARPRKGPIGLQLHDRFSFVEFRDIRIRTR